MLVAGAIVTVNWLWHQLQILTLTFCSSVISYVNGCSTTEGPYFSEMTRSGHVTTTLLVLSGISGAALDATLLARLIETCPADILPCVTGPMLHRVIVWYVGLKLLFLCCMMCGCSNVTTDKYFREQVEQFCSSKTSRTWKACRGEWVLLSGYGSFCTEFITLLHVIFCTRSSSMFCVCISVFNDSW